MDAKHMNTYTRGGWLFVDALCAGGAITLDEGETAQASAGARPYETTGGRNIPDRRAKRWFAFQKMWRCAQKRQRRNKRLGSIRHTNAGRI